jgi:leucyl-tRNA synthetase
LGNDTTVCDAKFPEYNEEYLKENSVKYTVSFNGKVRYSIDFPVDTAKEEIEKTVLTHENSQKWLDGKTPKKVIVVMNKVVNIVI